MDIMTIFFMLNVLRLPYEIKAKTRKHRRYSPHPAFTLFNTGMGRINLPTFGMPPSLNGGMPSAMSGAMPGAMSGQSGECIRDDIVCPSSCLMEDQWGCKSCPCGPANGMSPPRVSSSHSEPHQTESNHDCMGTILCMLTCKNGYRLGQRQENGCQTCTCKKKEVSMDATTKPPGADCTGPACSAKNGMRFMSQHFPAAPTRPTPPPKTTPAPKTTPPTRTTPPPKTTTKQPINCRATELCKKTCKYTLKLGKPGTDGCQSCSCVMKTYNKTQTTTTTEAPDHLHCRKAVSCIQSCSHGYQLGPATEIDGCPICKCLQGPTTPEPKPLLIIPVTPTPLALLTPPPCIEVDRCMRTCRYGYQVESTQYSTECPRCRCIIPLTPPPPTSTRKPDFMMILRTCPAVVHCIKNCPNGYTLKTDAGNMCPVCSCNRDILHLPDVPTAGPTLLLVCKEPLSCPQGCSVGYKCDELGCPSCQCIKPSETKLTIEVHTTVIQSSLRCLPNFSCAQKCDFGYRSGDNGCPTCECLIRLTVQLQRPPTIHVQPPQVATQAPPLLSATQGLPLLSANQIKPMSPVKLSLPGSSFLTANQVAPMPVQQTIQGNSIQTSNHVSSVVPDKQVPPQNVHVSGIGCLGPACSAPGARWPTDVQSPGTPLSGTGSLTGSGHAVALLSGSSLATSTGQMAGSSAQHTPGVTKTSSWESNGPTLENIMKQCPKIAKCLTDCNYGFDIGDAKPGECPPCACLDKRIANHQTVDQAGTVTIKADSSKTPREEYGSTTPALTTEHMPSVVEACPDTVKCMVGCNGPYNLTTTGKTCPDCQCLEKAFSCEANTCFSAHGSRLIPSTTPSPGECLAILHCVLTCQRGYDIGEVGKDGCPSCQCLD